ncbi:scp-like extracellular protein [Rutstroemia sp. NJR-2017a WRK4]|nr:scp-like extracellular protein [Rutstroemia sp. NJR-2017a WRK4]PQE14899.1 scp-like extracellular protein [Rutstroemia sp. NJR-2017a WRK4]
MRLQILLTVLFACVATASPIGKFFSMLKRQVVQTYDVTEVIYNFNGQAVATTILHVTTTVYPSTTLAPVPTATPTDYVSTALYHHNTHRANHSVPLLKWDTKLVASAQVLAATCHWGHNMTINGGGYGQNIAAYGASNAQSLGAMKEMAVAATDMWYDGEEPYYLPSYYGQNNPDMSTFETWGHYTQMVWLNTNSVGCATQYCSGMDIWPGLPSWYTVCNYYPPGNVGGQFGINVFPPLKHKNDVVVNA